MSYISYKNIADHLDLKKGDIVDLASDVTRIAYDAMEHGETFDLNIFIDTLLNKITDEGTILFATFNWDFCHNMVFDYLKTKGKTGALGNAALKRKDFKRTKHPLYSFAVWGKDKDYLCSLNNTDAFGLDSPFKYLYDNKAKCISADLPFDSYFTFCHYVEQQVNAPYRFMKYFESRYRDEKGEESTRKYSMFVKALELNVVGDADPVYRVFLDNGIAKESVVNGIRYTSVDIFGSYNILAEDVSKNNGKLQCHYIGQDEASKSVSQRLSEIYATLSGDNLNLSGDTFNYIKGMLPELESKTCKAFDYAEVFLMGAGSKDIVFSAKICPADIAIAVEIVRYIKTIRYREYNYRLIFTDADVSAISLNAVSTELEVSLNKATQYIDILEQKASSNK